MPRLSTFQDENRVGRCELLNLWMREQDDTDQTVILCESISETPKLGAEVVRLAVDCLPLSTSDRCYTELGKALAEALRDYASSVYLHQNPNG